MPRKFGQKLIVVLAATLAVEGVALFFLVNTPLDVGFSPETPSWLVVVCAASVLIHWPILRTADTLRVFLLPHWMSTSILFLGGWMILVLLPLLIFLVVGRIRELIMLRRSH